MQRRFHSQAVLAVKTAVALHTGQNVASVRPALDLRGDLNLDGSDLMQIVHRIEDELGLEVRSAGLRHVVTVGDLEALVVDLVMADDGPSDTPEWVQIRRPRPSTGFRARTRHWRSSERWPQHTSKHAHKNIATDGSHT